MENIISTSEIEETQTFKNLDKMFQNLLLKFASKKQITYGLTVFKNTGSLPGSIGGNPLRVVKEIIESQKSPKL